MPVPPLQAFVDLVGPPIKAAWLNAVDVLTTTIFEQPATKAAARTALTDDAPLEVPNGGTGGRTIGALITALSLPSSIGVDSGALNAYVFTHSGFTGASLSVGTSLKFTPLTTNTGPSTLNADGTGVNPIVRANGTALTGGELSSLGPTVLQWSGAAWQIVSTAGAQPGYERTALEIAAAVIPTNYVYLPGDVRRYNVPVDGVTDAAATLNAAAALPLIFPTETTCVTLSNVTLNGDVIFQPGATVKPAVNTWVKFIGRVQETGQSILNSGAAGNVLLTNNPQYSYANLTVNVVAAPVNPNDFPTIAAAMGAIPRYNQGHVLTLNIADGTWAEVMTATNKRNNDSSPGEFMITGDIATPSNCIVHGAIFRDCTGYLYPKVNGVQFSGGLGNTGGDEAMVMALGCQRVSLQNCIIDGTGVGGSPPADSGVLAYAGNVDLQQVTINNCHNRTKTKHGGEVNNTNLAIQSPTGVINSFVSGGGNGVSTDIKALGYFSGTGCPLPDSTNAGKTLKQGMSYDQYTGALAGPGFFLSSTTVHEDYFMSVDGYTGANTGDGTTTVGTGGLHATVNTGLVNLTLNRASIIASPSLVRPLMFLVAVKLTTLPAGATIYVGVGWPIPGAGDFIGFKISTTGISGVVRRGGVEVATTLIAGNQAGTTIRVGFFYSPGTSDTNVETTPTDQAAFFSLNGNTCVYYTMPGPFTDAGSMANRFTLYCNAPGSATDISVMGYRYVQV